MSRSRYIHTLAALLLAASMATPVANAASVTLSGFSNGSTVVNVSTPISPVHSGRYAGTLDSNSFLAFCIDLFQTLSFGTPYTGYTPVAADTYLGSAAKALDLGRLATAYLGSITNSTTSSAFQIAVWEIARETSGSYNVGSGSFIATPNGGGSAAAIAQADLWLDSLPVSSAFTVNVFAHASYQDLVSFSPVPLPGALALFAGGLGLLGLLRRRSPRHSLGSAAA